MFTDIFIFGLVIVLIIRGSIRGFWASLFDPLSVVISSGLAILYFKITQNIVIALCIGLLGPILLNSCFNFILTHLRDENAPKPAPSIISGFLGALITLSWGVIFLLPLMYLLTFLPPIHPSMNAITEDIRCSVIMGRLSSTIEKYVLKNDPAKKSTTKQKVLPSITSLPTVNIDPQAFVNDPKVQDLINDEIIKKNIEDKNYAALMSNPKVLKLAQDPEFIKKILAELKRKQESDKANTQPPR